MKFAIIVSNQDPAGLNIKKTLLEKFPFKKTEEELDGNEVHDLENVKLYTANAKSYDCENIDEQFEADYIIFATKHAAESGKPSLCVHTPGNWNKADFGGKEKTLCKSMPDFLRAAFLELKANPIEGFEVVLECTHHGPYLETPCMFIEIGSTPKEWPNQEAADLIAETLMKILEPEKKEKAIGLGGMHYAVNFEKVMKEVSVGHICPKYALHDLTKDLLDQALEKSGAKLVILDWKGLGKEKERLKELLADYNVKRTSDY